MRQHNEQNPDGKVKKSTTMNVPSKSTLVLLAKVRWKQAKALASEEGEETEGGLLGSAAEQRS